MVYGVEPRAKLPLCDGQSNPCLWTSLNLFLGPTFRRYYCPAYLFARPHDRDERLCVANSATRLDPV